MEKCEVGPRFHVLRLRPSRLLGTQRLPRLWRPLEGAALLWHLITVIFSLRVPRAPSSRVGVFLLCVLRALCVKKTFRFERTQANQEKLRRIPYLVAFFRPPFAFGTFPIRGSLAITSSHARSAASSKSGASAASNCHPVTFFPNNPSDLIFGNSRRKLL